MLKFIASDVDGTLIKDSAPSIYPEIHDEIKRITDKGIIFCIASGRQYGSVAKLFAPVADRLVFITDNGARIRKGEKDLRLVEMKREYVCDIVKQLRALGLEIVASTPDGDILETKSDEFRHFMFDVYHNEGRMVDDILLDGAKIIKLAAYKKDGIREISDNILVPSWKDKCKCCISGEAWLDFMDPVSDKGNAIRFLYDYFKIDRSETMVFGDNENDMGMLRESDNSYAVSNASDIVKQCAAHICGGYKERGVLEILRGI